MEQRLHVFDVPGCPGRGMTSLSQLFKNIDNYRHIEDDMLFFKRWKREPRGKIRNEIKTHPTTQNIGRYQNLPFLFSWRFNLLKPFLGFSGFLCPLATSAALGIERGVSGQGSPAAGTQQRTKSPQCAQGSYTLQCMNAGAKNVFQNIGHQTN